MSHELNRSKGGRREWTLESIFLGLLGAALIYVAAVIDPHLSVIEDTIVLVVFLGALLGVAPIPFPNLRKQKWLYPIVAGIISAFMDSFLVLLMVAAIPIKGERKEVLRFKALNMIAALIGGLLVYFGEVYALPHYLKYGMHNIYDGLPILVPILVFLGIVGYLVQKLNVTVPAKESSLEQGIEHHQQTDYPDSGNAKRTFENYIEFIIGVGIILITHNPILALGILFAYAFISGQGEDLLYVIKTETEMGVMLLLFTAWLIAGPAQSFFQHFEGLWAIAPSLVNAVFSGAVLPASGDVWKEIVAISTGALFLPISSLVGVMLFKTFKEWWAYVKVSVPLMVVWFAISMGWFTFIWPGIEPTFMETFNVSYEVEEVSNSGH